jgi:hypothetical protein
MLETPAGYGEGLARDNLSVFRYHTGAPPRALRPEEVCPLLFRDIGPEAMGRFLRGALPRLAGPLSPIIYLRTERWVEPYEDHGQIGRLLFLRPLALGPWRSGVEHIYVAHASRLAPWSTVAFVPPSVPLAEAASRCALMRDRRELREELGGALYDDIRRDTLGRLERLGAELAEAERHGEPLRRALQSGRREEARALMARHTISEDDLCAAWHHLPPVRRAWLRGALEEAAGDIAALVGGAR